MRKIHQGLFLLTMVSGLCLTSCSDESPWGGSDQEGGITLNLESDGRVMRNKTRADDTMCPIVPDAGAFGVKLYNADGSYSKTWSTVDAFNKEKAFPMGDYTIEAFYGDVNQEGFELPSFKGVNNVHVAPGATTDVTVSATLANAMVSMRYTDTFMENFPSYSAAVQTAGHDWVVFAQDENRPAFIDPSSDDMVKVAVTITNREGKTVTVEPASFKAQARHHYVVTINATGNTTSGELALEILFDDEVVKESVNISLGDDLFNSPAPSVKAKNFTDKEEFSLVENDEIAADPQFDIFAFGGFSEVNLNVITENGTVPTFGNQAQLVNAEALLQKQLSDAGVKVYGLYRNADKMAVVKVKDFIQQLPSGTYKIQLQAKDALTRLSEIVELSAKVSKMDFTLTSPAQAQYLAEEVSVDVACNSEHIKNRVTFKVPDADNHMVDATVKSVTPITAVGGKPTRADLAYAYRYVLEVAPVKTQLVDVEAKYGKVQRKVKVAVNAPAYTVDVDAFANFVVIRVNATGDLRNYLVENVSVYNGTSQVPAGNIVRDNTNGFIIVKGLKPGVEYTGMKCNTGGTNGFDVELGAFTTEAEAKVENGEFSSVETFFKKSIFTGGTYNGIVFTTKPHYQLTADMDFSKPIGWTSVNAKTCYENAANQNTWFVVPSTYSDNGTVVVRSVGYSHNGKTPDLTHKTGIYYCQNAPADNELTKASGELFLGSYSFNGSETRTDGVSFTSRPMSLTFDYKYVPVNGEQAQADIKVLDAAGNVLASGTEMLSTATTMTTKTISISSYAFGKKAAKLYVGFRSTKAGVTPAINIPSGTALKEASINAGNFTRPPHITGNAYKAVATGSVLTIDNVKLGYSETAAITAAPRRTHKK